MAGVYQRIQLVLNRHPSVLQKMNDGKTGHFRDSKLLVNPIWQMGFMLKIER